MPSANLAPDLSHLALALNSIAPSWRGRTEQQLPVQSTGFNSLDDLLPGGGWPTGSLIELLHATCGIGEVSLTLPALRQLCHAQRRVTFIDPPFTPHPPALQAQGLPLEHTLWIATGSSGDGLWAATQLLRTNATGAVLLWSPQRTGKDLRKLQLAAESGGGLAFLFRDLKAADSPSPAALRLELQPAPHALEARVRKARGGRPGAVRIPLPHLPPATGFAAGTVI